MTRESILASAPARINGLMNGPTLGNRWAQVRSKQLLMSVSPEEIGSISYNYSARQLIRNATAVLQMALRIVENDDDELAGISDALKRAAEIMEYIGAMKEGGRPATSITISAGLYQLAGYEANSLCLARSLSIPDFPTPSEPTSLSTIVDRWTTMALKRQFLRLRLEADRLQEQLPQFEEGLLRLVEQGDLQPESLADLPIGALAVKVFRMFAIANLLGPKSQDEFFTGCSEFADMLRRNGDSFELFQLRTFEGAARRMFKIGIWEQLADLVESDPLWTRYAVLSARGSSSDMLEASGRLELWESQRRALQAGLLDNSSNGLSLRMPTSSGKTRIAELAILRALTRYPGDRVVYVAPFRALADDIESSLAPIFADLGFRVSSVLGWFEVDELEDHLLNSANILITTPEKLALLLRSRPEFFENVALLVLDEGHIIEDVDRGAQYELLVTQLLRRIPAHAQILFLSAVISSENAADFAEWLCSDRSAVVETDWRPTRRLIGIFNAERNRITYPLESPVAGAPEPFVLRPASAHDYIDYTPKLRRQKTVSFPKKSKGELTAELTVKFVDQGPVLVFTTRRDWAESVARTIERALQLRRQTPDATVPQAFTTLQDSPDPAFSVEVSEHWLGADSLLPTLLRKGIGVHHAGLPEAVRRAIEDDFRSGNLCVLVATTTLAQGVNLPIKTVIVHTVIRHIEGADDEEGENKPIEPREFWNIAGRAGRATQETEGHIVLVALDDWSARQLHQFVNEEPHPIRGRLFHLLEQIAEDRLTIESFRFQIDSDLLEIMLEEVVGTEAEHRFEEILNASFVNIQARREARPLTPLINYANQALGEIRNEVPDAERRSIFAKTGFDVHSCTTMAQRIEDRQPTLQLLLTNSGLPASALATDILKDISDLPQMVGDYEFVGDLDELVIDWMNQLPMPEFLERHLVSSSDEAKFHRFLTDYFGYRLPWGIGAYIQIALHILNLGSEVSDVARWLPTMVRHGVSTAKATWPMTVGCPSRALSVTIAGHFIGGLGSSASYSDFIDWFSSLNEEDFVLTFGASANEARILTRRASALVPSDGSLTRNIREADLTYSADVVGLNHNNRKALLLEVNIGDELVLERDYQNQYDRNAVEVRHGGAVLGYLRRDTATIIAPRIDSGSTATAIATGVDRGTNPSLSLSISLETSANV